MRAFRPRFPRLRLAHRLGLAILLTTAAAFLLDQALRTLIPPPPYLLIDQEWLVTHIAQQVRTAETGTAGPREDATPRYLEFALATEPSLVADPTPSQIGESLGAALAAQLGKRRADVRVRTLPFSQTFWEQSAHTAVAIVPDLPALLTAEQLASDQSRVLGTLVIAVRLSDGRWLSAAPRNAKGAWRHYVRSLLSIGGNLLIIALFSFWMARRIVAPLSRLASAAERLGREREPTLIDGMRQPEFAAIAETFNAMQLRLKRFVDERVQMLAAISHDLRTPLTRLRLLAEYVGDDEQRTQLRANVAEMETMVADALAFMREEASREATEPVDLAALLISLADTCNDLGEDVVYEGPDHFDILCRPVAIKRAFTNLVANGCKYGGAVRLRLEVRPTGTAVVDVSDDGPGIALEDEERAFAPFSRLETSRSRETGGAGLGLAISRDVVRGHGGEISFRRGEGGFTVRVSLPAISPQRLGSDAS